MKRPIANTGLATIATRIVLLFGLSLAISLQPGLKDAFAAASNQSRASSFTGAWCAQGDPAKRCSISDNGAFLTLTNEGGDTSIGRYQGPNGIVAPGWQFVNGTLSPDGERIQWSNGTYWARCYSGGGQHRLNLTGTWYPNGNRSQSCSIRQHGRTLQLSNEQGSNATGQFDERRHVTTNWSGTTIGGTVSRDGNRIDWDNGTYWVRYRLYSSRPN